MERRTRREILAASLAACAGFGMGCATPRAPAQRPRSSYPVLRAFMEAQVAQKKIPGAVWLVAKDGAVVVETVGQSALDGATPMGRDTIFRIASMTKPVTAVAVMTLVEDGKLALDAPVERWLPELEGRRVLARTDGPLDETVAAARPITVRDLLTCTLGFGVVLDETLPIARAIAELQLTNTRPIPMTPHGADEWLARFATLPLMHQPGERWMDNTGSALQGVLVRRAAGVGLDTFVRQRVLIPLGMRDTDFHVPADKLARFAGCGICTDPQHGAVRMDEDGARSAYAKPPVFPSGAAGLVSTVDDYFIFARMLLSGGVHERRRLLSEESVHAIVRDQLTPAQKAASAPWFVPGFFETSGWGYGVAVVTAAGAPSPVGSYGCDGGLGTTWVSDPKSGLVAIAMTQSADFRFAG